MHTLRTIADVRPHHLVIDFIMGRFEELGTRRLLTTIFMEGMFQEPRILAKSTHWKAFTSLAVEAYFSQMERGVPSLPRNHVTTQDGERYLRNEIEFFRRVWEHQFGEIDSGNYKMAFLGEERTPVRAYLHKKGIPLSFLNRIPRDSSGEEVGSWVKQISSGSDIDNSLLFIPEEYANGQYGLSERLYSQDVKLKRLGDYKELREQIHGI